MNITTPSNKIYVDRKGADVIASNLHTAQYRFMCNMAMVNGIANIVLYDVYTKIREMKAYKHKIKKLVNAAVKASEEHEQRIKYFHADIKLDERYTVRDFYLFDIRTIKKKGVTLDDLFNWYMDIGSLCYSRNRRQTENLRNAIMQVFTRHQIESRDMLTELVFADTVLCFTLDIWDGMIRYYIKEEATDYSAAFKAYTMEGVYELIHEATCTLGHQIKHEDIFELAQDDGVKAAMKAFSNAVMYDFVSATSVDEAIEANKDIITKSRYRSYKERYNAAIVARNGKVNNEYKEW